MDWTVSDFQGQVVDAGMAMSLGTKAWIVPKAMGKGYFRVQARVYDTQAPVKDWGDIWYWVGSVYWDTSYAVIAPVDFAKVADTRFGLAGQFFKTMPLEALELVAKAGIAHIRDDAEWNGIEKTKGVFDFTKSDRYVPGLKRLGLTWCTVMAFGNKLYDNQAKAQAFSAAPFTPEGYEAYTTYIQEVLKHYGHPVPDSCRTRTSTPGSASRGARDPSASEHTESIEHRRGLGLCGTGFSSSLCVLCAPCGE